MVMRTVHAEASLQGVKERRKCQINATVTEDCISGRDVSGKRWMLTRKVRRIKGRSFSLAFGSRGKAST